MLRIRKIIHSSLFVEYKGVNIFFDPGDYLVEQNLPADTAKKVAASMQALPKLDLIIITHSHPDNLDIEPLRKLLEKSPDARIITNSEVAGIIGDWQKDGQLDSSAQVEIVEAGKQTLFSGISIKSFELPHVEIWQDVELPQNTGYMHDSAFLNPGDSYTTILHKPQLGAFMIDGPATKIKDALDYATTQKMQIALGVHDGMLNRTVGSQILPGIFLPKYGIQYQSLANDEQFFIA